MRPTRVILTTGVAIRRNFASSNGNKPRNYLDVWTKKSASRKRQQPSFTGSQLRKDVPSGEGRVLKGVQRPLLITGSSYLLPTLRLDRGDTAESLANQIAIALQQISEPNDVVKSMLTGSLLENGQRRWQVPIVLDLGALLPDGSPHYVPPRYGLLTSIVRAFRKFGIVCVGITNPPPGEIEKEAVMKLGLPSIVSKSARQKDVQFRIEEIVQLVLKRYDDDDYNNYYIYEEEIVDDQTQLKSNENNNIDGEEKMNYNLSSQSHSHKNELKTSDGVTSQGDVSSRIDDGMQEQGSQRLQRPGGGTTIYRGSVRSGQQVSAKKDESLIVIGSVNSGGEVMADNDVFVFGSLRGRCLAGLGGGLFDKENSAGSFGNNASTNRVFASSFDPELICIGETFVTIENVKEFGLIPGESAMVSLNADGDLHFESIRLK